MVQGENFTGAAPEATLIIIKVKPAKQYLRNFYLYPPEAEVFQEDDVMMAIAFAIRLAKELGVPLSICVGIGSSQGAHLGTNALSQYVDYVANFSQVSVSVAAGNEGNTRNHSTGIFSQEREKIVTELRVAEREQGFTMEFWGEPPEIYELSIQSPTGEILEVSSSIGSRTQELSFVFVETKVYVNYILIERQTGYSLVYIRFFIRPPESGRFLPREKQTERTVPYVASGGGADLTGYLFPGTVPLYNSNCTGRCQKQHYSYCISAQGREHLYSSREGIYTKRNGNAAPGCSGRKRESPSGARWLRNPLRNQHLCRPDCRYCGFVV